MAGSQKHMMLAERKGTQVHAIRTMTDKGENGLWPAVLVPINHKHCGRLAGPPQEADTREGYLSRH